MANPFFKFKEFIILQNECGQKVSTDACVFGGYLAQKKLGKTIVDVGSGSGLLCLMLAQKGLNLIGVEIEKECYELSKINIENSKFANQIQVINSDILDFDFPDHLNSIVCNPPFYNNTLPSQNYKNNLAKHISTLSPQHWEGILKNIKSSKILFYFLLPNDEILEMYIQVFSSCKYHIKELIHLRDYPEATVKRVIIVFSKSIQNSIIPKEICYKKNKGGEYSIQFVELLKEYYLYL